MDVRLLAFDLDGTFLAPDKSVTPRARRAVELLRERGIEPVPTTGRVYQTLFDRVLGMDGFRYAIAANGAVVLDVEGGRFLRRRGIEAPVAARLVRELARPGVVSYACLDDAGATRLGSCVSREEYERVRAGARWEEGVVPDAAERIELLGTPALKVGAHFREPCRYEDLATVAEGLGLWHAASEAGNIEIAPAGASKASGLATLCSKLGIPLAQVCAIGDGGNDAAMLREAGLGVAMGNAIPEALAAADEVAPTNAEDGFADFVERRLLG